MHSADSEYLFDLSNVPDYRWSGRFVAKDNKWIHMERQLEDYELIVMEKGTLYIEDEWGKYTVGEGEYLFMEPTAVQRGWNNSKCRFYWMHFFPGAVNENHKDGVIRRFKKQGKLQNADRLFVLMQQLQDSDLRYMDKQMNCALAGAVLCELTNQAATERAVQTDTDFQNRVDDYIFNHIGQPISVGEVAHHFGYHEKYFSSLFKEKVGCSVKQYVDRRKMERARYLILNTNGLVMEIAEHLGYLNIQNFYHCFKKENGCTPSEYREMYNKKHDTDI